MQTVDDYDEVVENGGKGGDGTDNFEGCYYHFRGRETGEILFGI